LYCILVLHGEHVDKDLDIKCISKSLLVDESDLTKLTVCLTHMNVPLRYCEKSFEFEIIPF
jgi:hypothetical protein